MQLLDFTLPTPIENVALDEALLLAARDSSEGGLLRIWEPDQHFVVIGRGSQVELEVDPQACRKNNLPVLRRCSGGCAIVAGPGCLMYSVIVSLDDHPQLRAVDTAHEFVMSRQAHALQTLETTVRWAGISDLAFTDSEGVTRKFSGNSLRISRKHILYHGTVLVDFSTELLDQILRTPPREPEYRQKRSHCDFVGNLPSNSDEIRNAIVSVWGAHSVCTDWPRQIVTELVQDKYSQDEWMIM